MKTYGIGDVYIHVFLTSALVGGEWSASRTSRFTPGESPGIHWIRGWVGLRADLDDVEKRKFLTLLGLEFRPLCRPGRSQSLYRLRYPGPLHIGVQGNNTTERRHVLFEARDMKVRNRVTCSLTRVAQDGALVIF
jgi:hypothetical protein